MRREDKQYFTDLGRHDLIPAEEEYELIHRAQAGDTEARDRMVTGNLRLVISIAKKYRHRGLPFMDLICAGNLSLFKAVERFDTSRGCKFSTYASPWVKQGMRRAIEKQVPKVHIPSYMQEIRRKVAEARSLAAAAGKDPSTKEILVGLGWSERQADLMIVNLDSAEAISNTVPHDLVPEPDHTRSHQDPSSAMVMREDSEALTIALAELPDRDRRIIEMRFGLDKPHSEGMTLVEISQALDPPLTKERVRQIIRASLESLRASLIRKGV